MKIIFIFAEEQNLIVTAGGKNVYPEEVENAFQLYFNDITLNYSCCHEIKDGSNPRNRSSSLSSRRFA